MEVNHSLKELNDEVFYTVNELCKILDTSRYTIYDLRNDKGLKAVTFKGGRKLYIKGSDIKALMVENNNQSADQS